MYSLPNGYVYHVGRCTESGERLHLSRRTATAWHRCSLLEEWECLVVVELERMESGPEYREQVEAGRLAVQLQGRGY